MNAVRLQSLARRWRRALCARDLGFALGAAGVAALMLLAPGAAWTVWPVPLAVFAGTLAWRGRASRWWELDAGQVARHLDRVHPELEESSALWLRAPTQLTLLEQLQLKRLDSAVFSGKSGGPANETFGRPPRGFLRWPLVCGVGGCLLLALVASQALRPRRAPRVLPLVAPSTNHPQPAPPLAVHPAWPKIVGSGVLVTPPAYTGRPPRTVDGFNAEAEEGATVAWTLALDPPVRDARLVFGEGAAGSLPLVADGPRLTARRTVADTGLYHLAATLSDGRAWNPPDVYSLKVIKDRPPTVRIVQPEAARTVLDPPPAGQPAPRVEVEAVAGDDYAVGEVRLVATVAKGSGEAVKFREQTLPFDTDTPDPAVPGGRRLRRTLDFGALGLEPGDELYFFIEATDNRAPVPNRTRSETRFLVLRGPEETATAAGQGIRGVNLVPQYFRSERQIIIDTEKLIADRPHLPDAELRQRANDLGGDQQLLRLRYGQFLGEELEEGSGDHAETSLNPLQPTPPPLAPGPRAAASVALRFRQEHEEQDREGGSHEDREAHAHPAQGTPLTAAQLVAPFVDQHDSQDKATFFDHETKGTMRDALAAMWEAERHLRVLQLDEALAPEHRALDILKDLQQSARSYVQRVGFEPPPLKVAERRFKGDVAGVPPRAAEADALPPDDPALAAARAALVDLPWHGAPPLALAPAQADLLARLEPALTGAATRQPDRFLEGLQALRAWRADGGTGALPSTLERALVRLLPSAPPLPTRPVDAAPSLGRAYAEALRDRPTPPEGRAP